MVEIKNVPKITKIKNNIYFTKTKVYIFLVPILSIIQWFCDRIYNYLLFSEFFTKYLIYINFVKCITIIKYNTYFRVRLNNKSIIVEPLIKYYNIEAIMQKKKTKNNERGERLSHSNFIL